MKKFKLTVVLTLVIMMMSLAACGSKSSAPETPGDKEAAVKNIMFVVTGSLGGGTNNDDVFATLKEYADSVGGNVDTFECNMDTSLFESTLMQAAETGEYDLIVTGFGTMIEPLSKTAAKYPNQKFFIFDTKMDYSNGANANVLSVQALQNQGGFLAGVMAAQLTTSKAPLANAEKVVGFVGAMESTAILDFLMGYIDGVNYVDPSIEVLYSFVGNHTDSALAKEMGLAQYQQGADVVFACGGNGLGVAEAALSADKYVIGVDFDYAKRLEATSKDNAAHVLSSVFKDYRGMVLPILESIKDGSVKWGSHTFISYADHGVNLVRNDYTNAIVPAEVWTAFEGVEKELVDGKVEVTTAFGASADTINKVKEEAKSH